jgi:two-component system response regulator HydG
VLFRSHTVLPLGGRAEVPFDARIVAATNHDIDAATRARRFRDDLYFRLSAIRIHLPPLRERGSDIVLLAQHFLTTGIQDAEGMRPRLTRGAADFLLGHTWPGNVRELENAMKSVVALARTDEITAEELGVVVRRVPGETESGLRATPGPGSLEENERRHLLDTLRQFEGNKTRAAQALEIPRRTLQRKLQALGISTTPDTPSPKLRH